MNHIDEIDKQTWKNVAELGQVRWKDWRDEFAKLIVQECAEVCRQQQYYNADDDHKRGVNGGSITCINAIKQYFGVE